MRNNGGKTQALICFYDAAIAALRRALKAGDAGDTAAHEGHLDKARCVLAELDAMVDTEQGELACNLHRLYAFMDEQLGRAEQRGDRQIIREVIGLLEEMNQSWRAITC